MEHPHPPLLDLNHVRVFVAVARTGGFAAAGRLLRMPTSSVSRHVVQLERHLGAQLLDRSTRHVRLTAAGDRLLARAQVWIDDADAVGAELRDDQTELRGALRVRWPAGFGPQVLSSPLLAFAQAHPRLQLALTATSGDIAPRDTEAFDLAITFVRGPAPPSDVVMQGLARLDSVVVAAPALLRDRAAPRTPSDLAHFPCVSSTSALGGRPWVFVRDGEPGEDEVDVSVAIRVDGAGLARQAALDGLGAAVLPRHLCGDDLSAGRLRELDLGRPVAPLRLMAVYPRRRHVPRKVRALADALRHHLVATGFPGANAA